VVRKVSANLRDIVAEELDKRLGHRERHGDEGGDRRPPPPGPPPPPPGPPRDD
jgi:hypothetical protein